MLNLYFIDMAFLGNINNSSVTFCLLCLSAYDMNSVTSHCIFEILASTTIMAVIYKVRCGDFHNPLDIIF